MMRIPDLIKTTLDAGLGGRGFMSIFKWMSVEPAFGGDAVRLP